MPHLWAGHDTLIAASRWVFELKVKGLVIGENIRPVVVAHRQHQAYPNHIG